MFIGCFLLKLCFTLLLGTLFLAVLDEEGDVASPDSNQESEGAAEAYLKHKVLIFSHTRHLR